MINRVFLIGVLALAVAACGGTSSTQKSASIPKVINGTEASQSELPQYVKILSFSDTQSYFGCTGTMIGSQAVLTAAHCILNGSQLLVQIDGEDGPVFYPQKIYIGDGYAGDSDHDIAVVILDRPTGRPSLPLLGSTRPQVGEGVMVVGFGLEEAQSGSFGTLRHGTMSLQEVTAEHLSVLYNGDGSNVCFGDSGGPAVYFVQDGGGNSVPTIAGVVSAGTDAECGAGDVTYYTSVENFVSSILEIVPDATVR